MPHLGGNSWNIDPAYKVTISVTQRIQTCLCSHISMTWGNKGCSAARESQCTIKYVWCIMRASDFVQLWCTFQCFISSTKNRLWISFSRIMSDRLTLTKCSLICKNIDLAHEWLSIIFLPFVHTVLQKRSTYENDVTRLLISIFRSNSIQFPVFYHCFSLSVFDYTIIFTVVLKSISIKFSLFTMDCGVKNQSSHLRMTCFNSIELNTLKDFMSNSEATRFKKPAKNQHLKFYIISNYHALNTLF